MCSQNYKINQCILKLRGNLEATCLCLVPLSNNKDNNGYFSEEHIALSATKTKIQRCEHRIRKNQQIKCTVHVAN